MFMPPVVAAEVVATEVTRWFLRAHFSLPPYVGSYTEATGCRRGMPPVVAAEVVATEVTRWFPRIHFPLPPYVGSYTPDA
jgi:hypothetical protein